MPLGRQHRRLQLGDIEGDLQALPARREEGDLMTTADQFNRASLTRFDLTSLMRAHKVTIRQLAERMGVTMKRVREVRAMDRVPYMVYCDYHEAVTGECVFHPGRFNAMCAQLQRKEDR
jgi:hypothetical protein